MHFCMDEVNMIINSLPALISGWDHFSVYARTLLEKIYS
jgi:hypothetical protein